jgi:hypothetical protein
MIEVQLNGLRLIPGIDYTSGANAVSFSTPPNMGDDILVISNIPGSTTGVHMQKLTGDGYTFLYMFDSSFDQRIKLQNLLDEVWEYQGVPAVQDLLEKLKVVIELVKQDVPTKTK